MSSAIAAVAGHHRVHLDPGARRAVKHPGPDGGEGLRREHAMAELARVVLSDRVRVPVSRLASRALIVDQVGDGTSLEDVLGRDASAETFSGTWSGWADLGAAMAVLHRTRQERLSARATPERPILPPMDLATYQVAPGLAVRCLKLVDATALAAAVARVGRAMCAPGLIHGDLKPDNILLDGRLIYLIDWERAGTGVAEEDLAAPLAALLTYRLAGACAFASDGAAGRSALRAAWASTRAAAEVFFDGYRRGGDDRDRPPVDGDVLDAATALKLLARAQRLAYVSSHLSTAAVLLLRAADSFALGRSSWRAR